MAEQEQVQKVFRCADLIAAYFDSALDADRHIEEVEQFHEMRLTALEACFDICPSLYDFALCENEETAQEVVEDTLQSDDDEERGEELYKAWQQAVKTQPNRHWEDMYQQEIEFFDKPQVPDHHLIEAMDTMSRILGFIDHGVLNPTREEGSILLEGMPSPFVAAARAAHEDELKELKVHIIETWRKVFTSTMLSVWPHLVEKEVSLKNLIKRGFPVEPPTYEGPEGA